MYSSKTFGPLSSGRCFFGVCVYLMQGDNMIKVALLKNNLSEDGLWMEELEGERPVDLY